MKKVSIFCLFLLLACSVKNIEQPQDEKPAVSQKETVSGKSETGAETDGPNDEKIYTEDELGVIVEWGRCGWSEVYNDTDDTVTLITSYPDGSGFPEEDIVSVIEPGKFITLDIGAAVPGVSIEECVSATVILSDGSEIVCSQNRYNEWSRQFFDNYGERQEYEVVDFEGKKLRHDLCIRTYHIDNALVELWLEATETPAGLWPPIELDKNEIHFPAEGGVETITALNYESWWINNGYEDAWNEDGEVKYLNFVYSTASDSSCECPFDILEGGWYHAVVPDKCTSNQMVITVDENLTGTPRKAYINMEAGDAFVTVTIYQQ